MKEFCVKSPWDQEECDHLGYSAPCRCLHSCSCQSFRVNISWLQNICNIEPNTFNKMIQIIKGKNWLFQSLPLNHSLGRFFSNVDNTLATFFVVNVDFLCLCNVFTSFHFSKCCCLFSFCCFSILHQILRLGEYFLWILFHLFFLW